LIGAAAIMPWLAKEKRRLSATTGCAALRSGCLPNPPMRLSFVIALVGLGINAIWHIRWAGPAGCLRLDMLSAILWEGNGIHARESLWLLLIWRIENSHESEKSDQLKNPKTLRATQSSQERFVSKDVRSRSRCHQTINRFVTTKEDLPLPVPFP